MSVDDDKLGISYLLPQDVVKSYRDTTHIALVEIIRKVAYVMTVAEEKMMHVISISVDLIDLVASFQE